MSSSSETLRFELDTGAERAVARLRLAGAAVVAVCVVLMALAEPSALGWVFAILLAALALGWTAAGWRGLRRAKSPEGWFLEAGPERLTLAERGQRLDIPWSQIVRIEVDEDRLVVAVHRHTGDPVTLTPRYRGVGLHELGEALRVRHRDAERPDGD